MRILITGGTGSLGARLTQHFVSQGNHVTIVSRNAHKQAELFRELGSPANLRMALGDINQDHIFWAFENQDILIHAAAQKRVERGESDPGEYIATNIHGTQSVIQKALSARIHRCLFISTDKSCQPVNFYGMTKAVAEHLWVSSSTIWQQFAALRYGNVVESNGSVWHLWKKQYANGEPLSVRMPEPTRFILSLNKAVSLVDQALTNMEPGDVLAPGTLPAFSVWDLAAQIQPDDTYWNMSYLTPGEKQHEILASPMESGTQISEDLYRLSWDPDRASQNHHRFESEHAPRISGAQVAREYLCRL